jgi:nucleoid-associated protein YgaU
MRRNAIHFAAAASLVLVLSGCSLFQKKGPDLANDPAYGAGLDNYDYGTPSTDSAYAAKTATSDPYAGYPSAQSYDSGTTASDAGLTGSSTGGARYHTVAKGDTLYALARRYYGEQRRWKDIYEANRSALGDPNKIRVGQRLLIP